MSNTVNKSQTPTVFKSKFNDNRRNKGPNQNIQWKSCGIKGHTIKKCYKLAGYPKEFKLRNRYNKNSNNSSNNNFSKNNYERYFSGNNATTNSTDGHSSSVNNPDRRSLIGEQFTKLL